MPIIEASNLVKLFGSFAAVDGISFDVAQGEVVAVLGANGAGKTTTMRLLTGYYAPTSGSVKLDGIDVVREPRRSQAMVGYLPEVPPLYPEMTVQSYLQFVARLRGARRAAARVQAQRAMERCWLADRADWVIGHLSRGYRQRVGIAQAIVSDPQVLILDEPTSGLDPEQILMVRKLIAELARDRTVLFSTHILAEAEKVCSRALIVRDGKLLADEPIASLVARRGATDEVRLTVSGSAAVVVPALEGLSGVRHVAVTANDASSSRLELHVTASRGAGLVNELTSTVLVGGWRLEAIEPCRPSLEDVYLKLVGAAETSA